MAKRLLIWLLSCGKKAIDLVAIPFPWTFLTFHMYELALQRECGCHGNQVMTPPAMQKVPITFSASPSSVPYLLFDAESLSILELHVPLNFFFCFTLNALDITILQVATRLVCSTVMFFTS